jgi:hypothetical protein
MSTQIWLKEGPARIYESPEEQVWRNLECAVHLFRKVQDTEVWSQQGSTTLSLGA